MPNGAPLDSSIGAALTWPDSD